METPAARVGRGKDAIRRHVQRALRERMTDNRLHTEILTVPHQLFLQHAAGLHIKAAIDGLVRHAPRLSLWICPLQPACYLLGRPVELQLSNNSLPQLAMHRQLARLWAQRLLPRELVSRS